MPTTVQLEDGKLYKAHLIRFYQSMKERQLIEANVEITSLEADILRGYMGQCYTIPLPLDSELIEHSMWCLESKATAEDDGRIWTSCNLRDADDLVKVLLPTLRRLGIIDLTLKSHLTGGAVMRVDDDQELLEWHTKKGHQHG